MMAKRRWRLTDRDLDILEFLARYGLGTAEQVRREFFGDCVNGAYRRLKALEEMKLVRGERVFYRGPGVFRVTEPGARVADVDLSPPRRDRERIHHALEVIELSWALRDDEYEEVDGADTTDHSRASQPPRPRGVLPLRAGIGAPTISLRLR